MLICYLFFFFSSRRRHTRFDCDWSSDVCSSDLLLRRDRTSSTAAQAMDTQVCAANSLAAIKPATAGVGNWANSMGTAMKPMADRLPHHRAAASRGTRSYRLLMDLGLPQ